MRLLDRLARRYGSTFWEGQASGAAVMTTSYGSPDKEAILPQWARWSQQVNATSAPVFAAISARMRLFSQAKFILQRKTDKGLYTDQSLGILQKPWGPGNTGSESELLARLEQDTSLTGNAFIWQVPGGDRLVRLRPDWTTIVSQVIQVPGGGSYREPVGYWVEAPKTVMDNSKGEMYPADEVVHWAPIPDPEASFRGMSWLTPVARDITGDSGLVDYKIKYLQNSASPNMLIRYTSKLQPGTIDAVRERMHARYGGVDNAFKTLVLDQGADVTVIGNSLEQMDFTNVQNLGTSRVLSASGVPAILVGLEDIKGAGKSYQEVIDRFSDLTIQPLWQSVCSALEPLVAPPSAVNLAIDTSDIAALQDAEQVRAQVSLVRAQALLTLTQAGFERMSAVDAVASGDLSQLAAAPDPAPLPAGSVQHLLPQAQPGATADPLPPALPRLPTGSTSPGDGGNGTRPTPRPAAARRAIEVNSHS